MLLVGRFLIISGEAHKRSRYLDVWWNRNTIRWLFIVSDVSEAIIIGLLLLIKSYLSRKEPTPTRNPLVAHSLARRKSHHRQPKPARPIPHFRCLLST